MAIRSETVYQLKITLVGTRPPVWRRVQVPAEITLGRLHRIIQTAMGWEDGHLHAFRVNGVSYGASDPELEMENESRIKLLQAAPTEKARFLYEYDFGDNWQHDILLEKIIPADSAVRYPVCVTGKRACPPEDCGGVWGYAEMLETLSDPNNENYEEMVEWVGGEFDPDAFDTEEVNRRLARLR